MNLSIPLTDEQKTFLANGIFRAVSQDMTELIYEHELPTDVGKGHFRWNYINRNLSTALNGDFEHSFKKRGAWKFLLLRDRQSELSFSIMSEQNLKRLQASLPLKAHYLEALVSDNANRKPLEGQTRILGMFPDRDSSFLSELKNQLFSGFSGEVKEHVLLLFDYNHIGVVSVRAVLLNANLEVAVSDDWTKYMETTFVPTSSPLAETLSGEDELLVTLKADDDFSSPETVRLPVAETGNLA